MSTIADRSYGERLLDNLGGAHWLDSLRVSAQQVEAVVHRLGAAGLERSNRISCRSTTNPNG
jgi:hypothetical protein